VNLARDAGERDLRGADASARDRHRLDTFREQFIETRKVRQSVSSVAPRPVRRQRIDNPDRRTPGKNRPTRGRIAAHDACADDANTQRLGRSILGSRFPRSSPMEFMSSTHQNF